MIELILLYAAAISIAVTASNKRCFAPVPARTRKRQP